jgi:KipI family sensor histidine kinase inhibitor
LEKLREVRPFGDAAVVASTRTVHEAHALGRLAEQAAWRGVEDVVVGMNSVTVVVDARTADLEQVARSLELLSPAASTAPPARYREIPVRFDGPDIAAVCESSGTSREELVESLTRSELEVAFLGFSPGFAYLTGLPPALAKIERRGSPRTAVEAGSVAIAGGFAAVYPSSSPGGWHVIGSTDESLFDPSTAPFAVLAPGDRVRFVPVETRRSAGEDRTRTERPARRPLTTDNARALRVDGVGGLSLVEDSGRRGLASSGVPRAGAADPVSLALANKLVGNDPGCAAIEAVGSGPRLRVLRGEVHAAVVGDCEARVNDRPVEPNTVLRLVPGDVVENGAPRRGARAYVAFDGGLRTQLVMGSHSSDVLCGLGPGPLAAGDVIGLGEARRARGRLLGKPSSLDTRTLRALPGPEDFGPRQLEQLQEHEWTVGADSNRVGVRMAGPALQPPTTGIHPRAMVTGAVQVPPNGNPIALLCDHATVGGYPVVATVITADHGRIGQLRAGGRFRLELVDAYGASSALAALERELQGQVVGWFPSRSD